MVPSRSSCCEAAYERRAAAAPPQRSVTVAQLPATPRRLSAADNLSRADDTIGTVMCLAKDVMNPVQVSPSMVCRLRFLNNQSNMRTNDTSIVPKRDFVGFAGNPSKTVACNVGCHAQSTFRGDSENDIQMCAIWQRGAKRGLRSKRIVSLSTAVSSSPDAVARNTRTCGNDLTPLKNGICS